MPVAVAEPHESDGVAVAAPDHRPEVLLRMLREVGTAHVDYDIVGTQSNGRRWRTGVNAQDAIAILHPQRGQVRDRSLEPPDAGICAFLV